MKRFLERMVLAAGLILCSAAGAEAQTPDVSPSDLMDLIPSTTSASIPSSAMRGAEDPLSRIPMAPIAGPVDPKTYHLGPGDVLRLQTWGRLSRSSLLQVDPEGYLFLPGSGNLRVEGKTLADLRTEILKRLESRLRGVSMDLRLYRPREFLVYLTGQVKSPGPVQAIGSSRVGDVVRAGLLSEDASRRRIEIMHLDGTRERADLDLFLINGRQDLNPWLRDGDVVNVPVATDFIWAQGALARPGRYELGFQDSLLTLFNLAGDPMPAAAVVGALLVSWKDAFAPESLWVRLDEVYDRAVNPRLREGDRLYVYYLPQYHLQQEAYIYGEIERPGVYPISEGRHHLSDLVKSAGGFLPTADLTAIRVHRRSPQAAEKDQELERLLKLSREQLTASEYEQLRTKLAGLREDYRVDWTRLTEAPKDLDLLLRDGDVVRVERLISSIRIDGEVRRPGILTYRPGQSIGSYVRQAGGYTDRAWRSKIQVTRAVTGQTLAARNVKTLDPGDLVWVPERPDRTAWDYSRDILTALAQVATVVIAIRSLR